VNAHLVTSLTNPTVKAVRALHLRKEREESGLFLAEGLKLIGEALEIGHTPTILMFGAQARALPFLQRVAAATEKAGGAVIEVTHDILEKVSRRENPQMVVAVFPQRFGELAALDPASSGCWVALQAVRDPGNLGTIVRTADAAGCGGVILVGDWVRSSPCPCSRRAWPSSSPGARLGRDRSWAPCSAPASTTRAPTTAAPP
jgi:TrmH family RNA methyltransferase